MASDIYELDVLHRVNRYPFNVILQHVTDIPGIFKLVCSLGGKQRYVCKPHTIIICVYHGTELLRILLL
jgi:hypothetical protein